VGKSTYYYFFRGV